MDTYKTVCDKCYQKTWYEEEQQCHRSIQVSKTCDSCGHTEYSEKYERCTGTLRKIDTSGLDPRFTRYYEAGQRIEVTYKWGEKERFYIGKSTGWKPCWITIKKSNSWGGAGLLQDSVISIQGLNKFK